MLEAPPTTPPNQSSSLPTPTPAQQPASGRDARVAPRRDRFGCRQPAQERSAAEWVTLAISSLTVGALIALTSYFYLSDSDAPASIEVGPRPAETFQNGTRYALPVVVRNVGSATAEDVAVRVVLTPPDGRQEVTEWRVQFLSGGATSRAVAIFASDPRQGHLDAGVVSYLEP